MDSDDEFKPPKKILRRTKRAVVEGKKRDGVEEKKRDGVDGKKGDGAEGKKKYGEEGKKRDEVAEKKRGRVEGKKRVESKNYKEVGIESKNQNGKVAESKSQNGEVAVSKSQSETGNINKKRKESGAGERSRNAAGGRGLNGTEPAKWEESKANGEVEEKKKSPDISHERLAELSDPLPQLRGGGVGGGHSNRIPETLTITPSATTSMNSLTTTASTPLATTPEAHIPTAPAPSNCEFLVPSNSNIFDRFKKSYIVKDFPSLSTNSKSVNGCESSDRLESPGNNADGSTKSRNMSTKNGDTSRNNVDESTNCGMSSPQKLHGVESDSSSNKDAENSAASLSQSVPSSQSVPPSVEDSPVNEPNTKRCPSCLVASIPSLGYDRHVKQCLQHKFKFDPKSSRFNHFQTSLPQSTISKKRVEDDDDDDHGDGVEDDDQVTSLRPFFTTAATGDLTTKTNPVDNIQEANSVDFVAQIKNSEKERKNGEKRPSGRKESEKGEEENRSEGKESERGEEENRREGKESEMEGKECEREGKECERAGKDSDRRKLESDRRELESDRRTDRKDEKSGAFFEELSRKDKVVSKDKDNCGVSEDKDNCGVSKDKDNCGVSKKAGIEINQKANEETCSLKEEEDRDYSKKKKEEDQDYSELIEIGRNLVLDCPLCCQPLKTAQVDSLFRRTASSNANYYFILSIHN